ncbi:MAG TPA: hypothetical protein VGM02_05805 [Acidobacteriaceae bacterium]|jgi:hypothetical protein
MGFIDDWSYVRTAFDFARSGHFVYNGWATAMLGWQIVWTAPFLKLFGYSFTVARLSMLPFAIGCGWLLHTILRCSGISNRNAIFGSLTFSLSPLFIPLAASYMSDVGGLFVILLCLYLCQRALTATSDRAAILWLCAAGLTNTVGGTERQIIWLGTLVVIPSTTWLLRKRRRIVTTAVALWSVSLVFIYISTRWFYRQPYSVPEKLIYPPVTNPTEPTSVLLLQRLRAPYVAAKLLFLILVLLKTALCFLLIALPILIAWLVAARKLGRVVQLRLAAIALALAILSWILNMYGLLEEWLMPWLFHVLDSEAISKTNWDMLGMRPVALPILARIILSIIVIVSGAALIEWSIASRQQKPKYVASCAANACSWKTLAVLYLPYTIAYVVLMLPRGLRFYIFDRYLLGILPIAIIFLLKLYEERVDRSLPALSYATLVAFACYGVAATHDLFALNRARVASVNEVRASGVKKNAVQAGFEYDGWTEIDEAGYVNESKIEYPSNAFHINHQDLRRPGACRLGFDPYTPDLHPQYIVVLSPVPCLQKSRFAPVYYRAWLPPFMRHVYIQEVPESMQDPKTE